MEILEAPPITLHSFIISNCYPYWKSRNTQRCHVLIPDCQFLSHDTFTLLESLPSRFHRTFWSDREGLTSLCHTFPYGCTHVSTCTFVYTDNFEFFSLEHFHLQKMIGSLPWFVYTVSVTNHYPFVSLTGECIVGASQFILLLHQVGLDCDVFHAFCEG